MAVVLPLAALRYGGLLSERTHGMKNMMWVPLAALMTKNAAATERVAV